MDSQKQQVVERLKQANNILVTVRSNPSVDQLAACIGVTLALNKMGKHATAVFSGAVPSTIEFLQPEKTLEKDTNSLQDFIIALDKSKADKLRYKVEDTMVKIFITPYRTSINQNDLQFSQGDFNVDVVLALGVHMQGDLDQAITSHGRILHDATVMSVNVTPGGEIGSVNWLDAGASSLSELCVQLTDALDQKLLDGQIATAFLTGIVAETDRFSNDKTSPQTMSMSAELMSAGANQQLVATKLEEPAPTPPAPQPIAKTPAATDSAPITTPKPADVEPPKPKNDDGTIEITHNDQSSAPQPAPTGLPPVPAPPTANNEASTPSSYDEPEAKEPQAPQIHIDDQGRLHPLDGMINTPNVADSGNDYLPPEPPLPPIVREEGPRLMTEPPTFETPPLTANSEPENEDLATDPLSLPSVGLLNREPLPSQPVMNQTSSFTNVAPSLTSASTPTSPTPAMPSFGQPSAMPTPTPMPSNPLPPAPITTQAPWAGLSPTSPQQSRTLSEIEQDVHSPHAMQPSNDMLPPDPTPASSIVTPTVMPPAVATPDTNVSDARDAVAQAISSNSYNEPLSPIVALNTLPLGDELHPANQPQANQSTQPAAPTAQVVPPQTGMPPSVPPPMVPPSFPQQ